MSKLQDHGIDTSKYKTSILGMAIKTETKPETRTCKEIQEHTKAELAGFVLNHPDGSLCRADDKKKRKELSMLPDLPSVDRQSHMSSSNNVQNYISIG